MSPIQEYALTHPLDYAGGDPAQLEAHRHLVALDAAVGLFGVVVTAVDR